MKSESVWVGSVMSHQLDSIFWWCILIVRWFLSEYSVCDYSGAKGNYFESEMAESLPDLSTGNRTAKHYVVFCKFLLISFILKKNHKNGCVVKQWQLLNWWVINVMLCYMYQYVSSLHNCFETMAKSLVNYWLEIFVYSFASRSKSVNISGIYWWPFHFGPKKSLFMES